MSDIIESTDIAVSTPRNMAAAFERAVELLPKALRDKRTLMMLATFPSDWHIEGDRACLSSAGAESIAWAMGDFSWEQDKNIAPFRSSLESAEGYMWTYTMVITYQGRTIQAQGHASTRDAFLGKKAGEYRDPADINEANIKRWARHAAIGEGIKQMLGLRGLPASELPDFARGGRPTTVDRAKPQGNAADDNQMRKNITDMLLALCDGDTDAAVAELENITTFTMKSGKDEGKVVPGVTKTSSLRGPRLRVTFDKVTEAHDSVMGGGQT